MPSTGPNSIAVGAGLWYRTKDALIAMTSIRYNRWTMGFSYDFNFSQLTPASQYRGGFEIALIYTNFIPPRSNPPYILPCMRF